MMENSDPDVVDQAKRTARQYRITLKSDGRGGFIGSTYEMPLVKEEGPTPDKCVARLQSAVTEAILCIRQRGILPPLPLNDRREEQINVRVSAEEKRRLELSARSRGLRGPADYLRTVGLEASRQDCR